MEIKEYIASQLRSYRAELKLSIQDVEEKSGINKDTICRYENASVSPNIEFLEKILAVYGIDFCIFFKKRYANKHNIDIKSQEKERG